MVKREKICLTNYSENCGISCYAEGQKIINGKKNFAFFHIMFYCVQKCSSCQRRVESSAYELCNSSRIEMSYLITAYE